MEKISFDKTQAPVSPQAAPATAPVSSSSFATSLQKENQKGPMKSQVFISIAAIVLLLGLGTGFAAAKMTAKSSPATQTATTSDSGNSEDLLSEVKAGQVVGAKDSSSFKDSAEGVLLPGGAEGEGSHHIVRPGGVSQTVYLTSSVMDLSQFENHKVKVWGETFTAKKAGWLMDVGRLEVLELNAPLPDGAVKETAPAAGGNE